MMSRSRVESVRIEGNPLARSKATDGVKPSTHVHIADNAAHEAAKLKVENLADARMIRNQQLQALLDKLGTFE